MSYIYPAPGVTDVESTLTISVNSVTADTGYIVPALQDVTLNAANDVYSWTQLDSASKLQIATTSSNSLSMNIVLDQEAFFGRKVTIVANESAIPTAEGSANGHKLGDFFYATTEETWSEVTAITTDTLTVTEKSNDGQPAVSTGIFQLSTDKTLVDFSLYLGDTSGGDVGKTISGSGYLTGLAPTVSADSPVWVSPITLTVTGDYTVA